MNNPLQDIEPRPLAAEGEASRDARLACPFPGTKGITLMLCTIGFAVMIGLQFCTPALVGTDSYYHSKFAVLLSTAPILEWPISFPWLPLTVLAEEKFTDHHFLFHVFLIPFVKVSLVNGSKMAAALLGALTLVCFHAALPTIRSGWRVLATLAFFAVSPAFLFRMSMVRAQSMSLCLLFLLVICLRRKNYVALIGLSGVYVWAYNAFPLLVILSLTFVAFEVRHAPRSAVRILSCVSLGLAGGLIINPSFPQNVYFLKHHLVDKFDPTGYAVRVGNEWYPYSFIPFSINVLPGILVLFSSLWLARYRFGNLSNCSRALLLFSLIVMGMTLKSRRFVELFPPFVVLTFVYVAYDILLREPSTLELSKLSLSTWLRSSIFHKVVTTMLLLGAVASITTAGRVIRQETRYEKYQKAAAWLETHTSPGELIVTADWDDFPRLFHFNTHNRYLVGLDPYFLYAADPKKFKKWRGLTRGEFSEPIPLLAKREFESRFIFIDRNHPKLESALIAELQSSRVYSDDYASIFELKSSPGF